MINPYETYNDNDDYFDDEWDSQPYTSQGEITIVGDDDSTWDDYYGPNLPDIPRVEISGGVSGATWASGGDPIDWRVRLSIPPIASFQTSPLLAPLVKSNNSLVFPYTPNIVMGQSANYNSLTPIHSNYPFMTYQNSQIDSLTITGEFFCETARDAAYWVGAVHYLRSVTKMFYGESSNLGAPPPIVKLNGYGDFVFNNVPVVITNFTVDMQSDVDYVSVVSGGAGDGGSGKLTTYAPSQSLISVTCQPVYSRKLVSEFSLDSFVRGEYAVNRKGFI